MRHYLIIIALVFSTNIYASVTQLPSKNDSKYALKSYSWMVNYKQATLFITMNEIADEFISNKDLSRYFKLRMQNFVKDIKFSEDYVSELNNNIFSIQLELYKYNKQIPIYYGLLSLKVDGPFIASDYKYSNNYEYTYPIAGSEAELTKILKQDIDTIIEIYAENYFYIADLKSKHKVTNK